MMVLRDAVLEEPTVPIKEGVLRGSGSAFSQGVLVGTSENLSKEKGTPNLTDPGDNGSKDEIVAVVGYNTPYAHRQHEGVGFKFSDSDPPAGAKFLETKLARYTKQYWAVVAEKIAEVLGRA
jgi:hypothetical protein